MHETGEQLRGLLKATVGNGWNTNCGVSTNPLAERSGVRGASLLHTDALEAEKDVT